MIRPLRSRHRGIFILLLLLLPGMEFDRQASLLVAKEVGVNHRPAPRIVLSIDPTRNVATPRCRRL